MNTDHQQGDGVAGPGDAIPPQLFHAALPNWKAWAALHVRDEAGRILLLHSATGWGWQHPGGHADQGELPHETAEREVLEETGHKLSPGPPLALVISPPRNGVPARFGVVFDGGVLTQDQAEQIRIDPGEHDEFHFATVDDWAHLLPPDAHVRLQAYEAARCSGTTAYLTDLG
ncbi:NUDIX domain-containing protein [Streptomyces sp. NRRL B-24484]|uniref:NUDIX domain-containing protein n=1 Tax=Streptomyces sp. NRRL B-24484 TaxID=1463833 RepID=UPI000693E863|nr:NUDIX hydrolase [Streptomyces sp. NRRL B-24484]